MELAFVHRDQDITFKYDKVGQTSIITQAYAQKLEFLKDDG